MYVNREQGSEVGWAGALSGGAGVEPLELGVRVALGGLQARRVHVRAACAAPGSYALGAAFSLTSRREDTMEAVAHACTNSSLLVVQQAG